MPPLLALLALALVAPASISSLALESTDPLTGQASRWEGWVGTLQASGLPDGAGVELVDGLGAPLTGSQATATAGRANLSAVSRLPGLYYLAINGTPTADSVLLDGSFNTAPVLFFEGPGKVLHAEVCVEAVRNSAGRAIPNASRVGIPVTLGGAGARTNPAGCALLPAPREGRAILAGLPGPEVPAPSVADGLLFSSVEAGGQAATFFERGFLRAVRLSAAADLANFTLVVEPKAGGAMAFWSRANASGVARIFLLVEGRGTPEFCPRLDPEGCSWSPLPAVPIEGSTMAPLPGFGVIRINTAIENMNTSTLSVLASGIAISSFILLRARKRRPPLMPASDKQ